MLVIQLKDTQLNKKTYFHFKPILTLQPVGVKWVCYIGKINPQLFVSTFPGCLPPKITLESRLLEMVDYGVVTEVKKLIAKGADVNHVSNGQAPLFMAITKKKKGMVKLLLKLGADVELINHEDFGRTPLMYAVLAEHLGIIKILVENGANVNAKDSDGESVLEYIAKGNEEIEDYLIDNGAEVQI